MKISINNISKTDIEINKNELKRYVRDILTELGESKVSLNIALVNNEHIKELNFKYRKINRATDILAFPAEEKEESRDNEGRELGDIAISLEMAKLQSKIFKHSIEKEVILLLTHGILHLLGYDHLKKEDEKKMNSLLETLIEKYYRN